MSKIFLGGPISNAIHNNVFDEKIKEDINRVYEKLESKDYEIFSAHKTENFGENQIGVEEMFEKDIKWIYEAERAIFLLSYNEKEGFLLRTDGSYIEIGVCYARNIPITLISNAPKEKFPTMLQSMRIYKHNKIKFITLDEFLSNGE